MAQSHCHMCNIHLSQGTQQQTAPSYRLSADNNTCAWQPRVSWHQPRPAAAQQTWALSFTCPLTSDKPHLGDTPHTEQAWLNTEAASCAALKRLHIQHALTGMALTAVSIPEDHQILVHSARNINTHPCVRGKTSVQATCEQMHSTTAQSQGRTHTKTEMAVSIAICTAEGPKWRGTHTLGM